ncbi:MAG: NAD-glutamate dehydrogenase domain-containing protein [Hyphomicrobium sp.]
MISNVLNLLLRSSPAAKGIDVFSKLLLAGISGTRLGDLDNKRLAEFAGNAFDFLTTRPTGRHKLRVTPFQAVQNTAGAPATLIEILTGDTPFVVDSAMGEIQARGWTVAQVLRPIFKTHRYASERLREVYAVGDDNWADGHQECYLAILVEPMEPGRMQELAAALDGVLTDVYVAVADERAMRSRLSQAVEGYQALPRVPDVSKTVMQTTPAEILEAIAFIKWLAPENFIILGTRDYDMVGVDQKVDLWPSSKGALGLLRNADFAVPVPGKELGPRMHQHYFGPAPLTISKTSAVSRVHKRQPFDYVGMKRYNTDGRLVGELRVIGLFTPAAYLQSVKAVPIVRRNVYAMLTEAGPAQGHRARTLLDALESFPRDELLQASRKQLLEWMPAILDMETRPRTAVLARRDVFESFVSVLVFLARDRYTADAHKRIESLLAESYASPVAWSQSGLAGSSLARISFNIPSGGGRNSIVETAELERSIDSLVQGWEDRLAAAISNSHKPEQSNLLRAAYLHAFPPAYRGNFDVTRALQDVTRLEKLQPQRPVSIEFYRRPEDAETTVRLAYCRLGEPSPLTERLPLCESVGLQVVDEQSFRLTPQIDNSVRLVTLHDMVLKSANGLPIDLGRDGPRMQDGIRAILRGEIEGDPFNALVHAAGATWREAALLRACGAYLHQVCASFGTHEIAVALARNAGFTRDLIALFHTRLDPDSAPDLEARRSPAHALRLKIDATLRGVEKPDERRILAASLALVVSIARTNYYLKDASGGPPDVLAFKLEGHHLDGLPGSGAFRETWVHGPRMDGLFLRGGPIARGSIRKSSRPLELRSEAVALCRARQAENAGTTASGAQGAFIRRTPASAAVKDGREADLAACRGFIEAVLSLTDSVGKGGLARPPRVVAYDAGDAILSLVPDAVSTPFTDTAREIGSARGFWLGDAFVVGGSNVRTVVARGLWQSVHRHFTEASAEVGNGPLRIAAAGDMADGAFAAGMQTEANIRLVAAFDDRFIFIDPDPDPAVSRSERERLIGLPRPTWDDYDRAKISAGGGVFPRAAETIVPSPEMRTLLCVEAPCLSPDALLRAILCSPVDVLWLAGSATNVRAGFETDAEMGDPASSAARIVAPDLRARAIVEAVPGLTQRARIEAALQGVALNTSFVDGAIGAAMADLEFNARLALTDAAASGRILPATQQGVLSAITGEGAALGLADHRAQFLTLSLAVHASRRDLGPVTLLARDLEQRGAIDRSRDALPTESELGRRSTSGTGLTRPELAVLTAASRIQLRGDLLATSMLDAPALEPLLVDYFPPAIRDACAAEIRKHRHRREIIASRLANLLTDFGGPAIVARLAASTGRSLEDIAVAILGALQIFSISETWREVDALDGRMAGGAQLDVLSALQDVLFEAASRVLDQQRHRDLDGIVACYHPAVLSLTTGLAAIVTSRQAADLASVSRELARLGVPKLAADRIAGFAVTRDVFRIDAMARQHGRPIDTTAHILFATQELFKLDKVEARAANLKIADRYDKLAIDDALKTLQAAKKAILTKALAEEKAIADVAAWATIRIAGLKEGRAILDEIADTGAITISQLTLAASHLKAAADLAPASRSAPTA